MAVNFERNPSDWVSEVTSADDVQGIIEFLQAQGTFHFPRLDNGLFSAAAAEGGDFELTGYRNIWTRDNIHIAHAHWVIGETDAAVKTVKSLAEFYLKYRTKFTNIIEGKTSADDPMNRPHIRFNGEKLTELPEKWSHAQNDALGYFLWLYCLLVEYGEISPSQEEWELISLFPKYFEAVQYWQDEDNGHWEEVRKIAASSIGVALAGLRRLQGLIQAGHIPQAIGSSIGGTVRSLVSQGEQALLEILPAECVQADPAKHRPHDSATLFLLYPCELFQSGTRLDEDLAVSILKNVRENLMGDHGIRRYNGDSYWCADYKTLLSAETRTTDFSDDMSSRDALLKPGFEAQWCIFDPILAVVYSQRFLEYRDEGNRHLQQVHLTRSLSQLTLPGSPFGAYRCPESYYFSSGAWGPNDLTPLLWSQANLRLALHWWKKTLA